MLLQSAVADVTLLQDKRALHAVTNRPAETKLAFEGCCQQWPRNQDGESLTRLVCSWRAPQIGGREDQWLRLGSVADEYYVAHPGVCPQQQERDEAGVNDAKSSHAKQGDAVDE